MFTWLCVQNPGTGLWWESLSVRGSVSVPLSLQQPLNRERVLWVPIWCWWMEVGRGGRGSAGLLLVGLLLPT